MPEFVKIPNFKAASFYDGILPNVLMVVKLGANKNADMRMLTATMGSRLACSHPNF